MTRSLIATYFIVVGGIMTVGIQTAVPALERAVAVQCLNHAWPATAHQVHMDWCAANNYPTH
jgi:hypothetical protein